MWPKVRAGRTVAVKNLVKRLEEQPYSRLSRILMARRRVDLLDFLRCLWKLKVESSVIIR